ncbi:MAG: ParB/RepB/Spo0J family partition protein [Flavobacteriales bacterium]|jgi:ParB family chromosome partitioning protein
MKSKKESVQELLLSSIVVDPNQPRKTFKEESLIELGNSIKELGLMQPIVVRPIEGKKYMIIAGERRYRASLMVNLDRINCIIKKDLSDDIILEMQIVENLQREEIDPIEESDSFNILKQLGYSVEDIALKIGKSVPFVYQRFSLAQLNDGFKKMVSDGVIKLTYALKISALNEDKQKALFDTLEGEWNKYQFESFLKQESFDLKNANFDLSKENIVVGCSACSTCVFNTLNQGDLFSDGKQFCTNIPCFEKKQKESFISIIKESKKEDRILVANEYSFSGYNSDNMKRIEAILIENKVIPFGYGDGWLIEKPTEKMTLQDFEKEHGPMEDQEELEEDYKDYIETFENEKKEWEEALNDKRYLKANKFSTFSLDLINDTEYLFLPTVKEESNIEVSKKKMDDCTNEEKVQKLKAREIRKKEIEGTKLLKELYDLPHFENDESELTDLEKLTFVFSTIKSADWNKQDALKKSLGDVKDFDKLLKKFDNSLFNRFVRVFIKSQVSTYENCSIASNEINKGFYEVIKLSDKKNVIEIEKLYDRNEKDRIKKLEEKIQNLT